MRRWRPFTGRGWRPSRGKVPETQTKVPGCAHTMYPVLFRIGSFEITSFGAMVAVGALVGLWLFRRELLYSRLPESGVDAAVAGLAGGIAGAKLLWVFEHL